MDSPPVSGLDAQEADDVVMTPANQHTIDNREQDMDPPSPRPLDGSQREEPCQHTDFDSEQGDEEAAYFVTDNRSQPRVAVAQTKGMVVPPRFSFCSWMWNDTLYVWGGRKSRDDFITVDNEIFKLHLETKEWTVLPSSKWPDSLTGAKAVVHDNSVYIFGGYHDRYRDSLLQFDLVDEQWHEVVAVNDQDKPRRRWHYSAVVYDAKLWIFGGTMDRTHFDDLHCFDFARRRWIMKSGLGSARRRHTAVVWQDYMFVFGGRCGDTGTRDNIPEQVARYSFLEDKWDNMDLFNTKFDTSSMSPPKATDHSAVVKGDWMYVVGCKEPYSYFRYHFPSNQWFPVIPQLVWDHSSPALEPHSDPLESMRDICTTHHGVSCIRRDSMFFFGGQTKKWRNNQDKKISKDVVEFHLGSVMCRYGVRSTPDTMQEVLQGMACLLESEELSDIKFICQSSTSSYSETIHAHRSVLAARCSYFKSMFTGGFVEKSKEDLEIVVEDCPRRVLAALLRFLYTGERWVSPNINDMLCLVRLADQYNITTLKDHCGLVLADHVDRQGALQLLKACQLFNMMTLKAKVMDFVITHFSWFAKAGEFSKWIRSGDRVLSELHNELMLKVAEKLENPTQMGSGNPQDQESPKTKKMRH